jgi:hypothetical protein
MSDFLSNLVGRSLGTVEVVRPRVPSLYEPYRRGSGPFAPRPDVPAPDANFEPAAQPGLETEANPIPHSQNPEPHMRPAPPPHPPAGSGHFAKNEPSAEQRKISGPSEPSEPEPPSLIPRTVTRPEPIAATKVPSRHDPASGSSQTPASPPAAFDLSPPLASPRSNGPSWMATPPGELGGNSREADHPLAESPAVTEPGIVRRPHPPEMKTEASSSRLDLNKPATPSTAPEPSPVAHQVSPVASVVRPPIGPSIPGHQEPSVTRALRPPIVASTTGHQEPPTTNAGRPAIAPSTAGHQEPPGKSSVRPVPPFLVVQQPSLVASAVRPPVAPRSGGVRNPEALPASSAPAPAIQVSIGRVEVRAIFPEPVVRSTPAARSGPTVSLDDYLHQRGKR